MQIYGEFYSSCRARQEPGLAHPLPASVVGIETGILVTRVDCKFSPITSSDDRKRGQPSINHKCWGPTLQDLCEHQQTSYTSLHPSSVSLRPVLVYFQTAPFGLGGFYIHQIFAQKTVLQVLWQWHQ